MFEKQQDNKSENLIPNWIKPNLRDEAGEIKRVLEDFLGIEPSRENIIMLANVLEAESLVELTDELWEQLENTDSFHKVTRGDFETVEKLTEEYNKELPEGRRRSVKNILDGFQNSQPMEAPTIVENREGKIHLISGNTRLMTARALGIRPRVIIGKL